MQIHQNAAAVPAATGAAVDVTTEVPPPPCTTALSALCLIARLHHIAADPAHLAHLAHQLGWPPSHQPDTADLLLAAKHIGLKARLSRSTIDRLKLAPLPALALLQGEGGEPRVVVLAQCDGQRVLFQAGPPSSPSACSPPNGAANSSSSPAAPAWPASWRGSTSAGSFPASSNTAGCSAKCCSSRVGEQGASLSGGQRQRIAIARALFTQPRILLLDEATSALDYESEAILQKNMGAICEGRTVIIIAHRLSSVRHANRIIVMDKGTIVEEGPHDALLHVPGGLYAHLWSMQGGAASAAAARDERPE